MMIDTREAARRLGVGASTLRTWRTRGIGPAYVRDAGTVLYDEAVIAAYVHQPRKPGRPKGSRDSQPRVRRAASE